MDVAVLEPEFPRHGTAAVVIGVLPQEARYQGRDSPGRFRVSLAVVGVRDDWRLASVRLGPLPQPRSAAVGRGAGR